MQHAPTARPRSLITGQRMEKIEWGPNWEEILGGEFAKRSKDPNFDGFEAAQKAMVGEFENTFMMYLPRLCEHCLNPACVASCPSGSIYKREEDGIVLIDQDKCRGWRMCVSGCPYKKIYYNWKSGKAEKCIFCYPRIEAGQPTVCSETCVGRIRYLGVLLYDADRIAEAASVTNETDLYKAQLDIFLDPHDPKVIEQARADGIPDARSRLSYIASKTAAAAEKVLNSVDQAKNEHSHIGDSFGYLMLGGGEYNRMTRTPTLGGRPNNQTVIMQQDFDVFGAR